MLGASHVPIPQDELGAGNAWDELGLLADPLRRAIFDRLIDGPLHVNAIVAGLKVTQSAVSQQLKKMKQAGLVNEERQGKYVLYSICPSARRDLLQQLQQLRHRLDGTSAVDAMVEPRDAVDIAMEGWEAAWPGLNAVTMGILLRIDLVHTVMVEASHAAAQRFGMKFVELMLLGGLERAGPPYEATLTQLSQTIISSVPYASKHLSNAEKSKFVERRANTRDGRSNILQLTPLGRESLHKALNYAAAHDLRGVYQMSAEQRALLVRATRMLLAVVKPQPASSALGGAAEDEAE